MIIPCFGEKKKWDKTAWLCLQFKLFETLCTPEDGDLSEPRVFWKNKVKMNYKRLLVQSFKRFVYVGGALPLSTQAVWSKETNAFFSNCLIGSWLFSHTIWIFTLSKSGPFFSSGLIFPSFGTANKTHQPITTVVWNKCQVSRNNTINNDGWQAHYPCLSAPKHCWTNKMQMIQTTILKATRGKIPPISWAGLAALPSQTRCAIYKSALSWSTNILKS